MSLMIFPTEKARKPRKTPYPDMAPVSAETMLVGVKWQKISWRGGTKGPLTCLLLRGASASPTVQSTACSIKVSSVCLVMKCGSWASDDRAESRSTTSRICPLTFPLKTLAAAVKARWICEQAHQQLKEELGLDHFEGRSWAGLHRHALMTMIAYAFLQSRRLTAAGRKKAVSGPPPQPSMPAIRQAILDLFVRPPPLRCTHCEMLLARRLQLNLPK